MNILLAELREEFHQKMERSSLGVKRQVKLPEIPNKITVTIGMRRTGKTYFLLRRIHALLKKVPFSQVLYLNKELKLKGGIITPATYFTSFLPAI